MPVNYRQLSEHDKLALKLQPTFINKMLHRPPLDNFFAVVLKTLQINMQNNTNQMATSFNQLMKDHLNTYLIAIDECHLNFVQTLNHQLLLKLSSQFERLLQQAIFHNKDWFTQFNVDIQTIIDHHSTTLAHYQNPWFQQFADLITVWSQDVAQVLIRK